METLADNAALVRFAKGDLAAFETLFRESQHNVYRWILRIVRDPEAAKDLTIETFWRIHKAHARFDPTRSFEAWARRIATNVAIGHLKRSRVATTELGDVAAPTKPDSAVQRDNRERIRRAFQSLPVKLRVPALLALVEETPQDEIAQALGISQSAVKSRVYRATQLLREKLTQMGITP